MDVANLIGAFAGGVGGGLYAANVVKSKIEKLEQEFKQMNVYFADEHARITQIDDEIKRFKFFINATYEQHSTKIAQELNRMNNKINNNLRKKK